MTWSLLLPTGLAEVVFLNSTSNLRRNVVRWRKIRICGRPQTAVNFRNLFRIRNICANSTRSNKSVCKDGHWNGTSKLDTKFIEISEEACILYFDSLFCYATILTKGLACYKNDISNCLSSLQDTATGQTQSNDLFLTVSCDCVPNAW